jgi:hypothetical protein
MTTIRYRGALRRYKMSETMSAKIGGFGGFWAGK